MPSKPIARYAGPGLLARIITAKFAEYTAHYRQSEIYLRQGDELSRVTLGRGSGAVSERLRPLYDLLKQYARMQSLYDGIQVQMKVLSRHSDSAKAFANLLKQWDGLNVYCSNGWAEINNNIAENVLRDVAQGRKNWLFAGSDKGGDRAAVLYSLIGTCRLYGVDPEAWRHFVLSHIQEWPVNRLRDLLPWKSIPHLLYQLRFDLTTSVAWGKFYSDCGRTLCLVNRLKHRSWSDFMVVKFSLKSADKSHNKGTRSRFRTHQPGVRDHNASLSTYRRLL